MSLLWNETYLKDLGKHIRSIRKSKNLTQAGLGDILELDEANIRRIELGLTNPTIRTLYSLSKALEVDIQELIITNNPKTNVRTRKPDQ